MRKLISIVGGVALLAGLCLAEEKTPAQLSDAVYDIQTGKNSVQQIKTLRVKDNATIGGTLTVTGAIAAPVAATTLAATTLTQSSGALITNTCVSATGKTNTYVFAPFGGMYVVKTITTSP